MWVCLPRGVFTQWNFKTIPSRPPCGPSQGGFHRGALSFTNYLTTQRIEDLTYTEPSDLCDWPENDKSLGKLFIYLWKSFSSLGPRLCLTRTDKENWKGCSEIKTIHRLRRFRRGGGNSAQSTQRAGKYIYFIAKRLTVFPRAMSPEENVSVSPCGSVAN